MEASGNSRMFQAATCQTSRLSAARTPSKGFYNYFLMPPKCKFEKNDKKQYERDQSGHLQRRWVDKLDLRCDEEMFAIDNLKGELESMALNGEVTRKMLEEAARQQNRQEAILVARQNERKRMGTVVEQLSVKTNDEAIELGTELTQLFNTKTVPMDVCDRLQNEVDIFAGLGGDLTNHFTNLQCGHEALQSAHSTTVSQLEELRIESNAAMQQISTLQAEKTALQNDVFERTTAFDDLTEQCGNLSEEHQELPKDRNSWQNLHGNLSEEHELLKTNHTNLQKERDDLQKTCEGLKSDRDEDRKLHTDLQRDLKALKDERDDLTTTLEGVRAQLQTARTANTNQSGELDELVLKYAEARQRLKHVLCEQEIRRGELSVMREQRDQAARWYTTKTRRKRRPMRRPNFDSSFSKSMKANASERDLRC